MDSPLLVLLDILDAIFVMVFTVKLGRTIRHRKVLEDRFMLLIQDMGLLAGGVTIPVILVIAEINSMRSLIGNGVMYVIVLGFSIWCPDFNWRSFLRDFWDWMCQRENGHV